MVQSFQFFRLHSVPSSFNDYTLKATAQAVRRREEACAVCAVRDWLENRYPVRLFTTASRTTTWKKFFYGVADAANEDGEDECRSHSTEDEDASGGPHPASCSLLIDGESNFCVGPKEKVHALLDVERYIQEWPLIPIAELHASSVQHPDDRSMRWLLHSRRVTCLHIDDVPKLAQPSALPRCAGIGDKDATVWVCKLCVLSLCIQNPKMPPLALANSFFGGRHHAIFREVSFATSMLSSSARVSMRQLFLARGEEDEVHKGMTGNTMLISHPSPS